jgi:biopolymer transport protein ExbD
MNFFGFFAHGGDEIDLAPLVDIAFLLLTFFMMTTTFTPKEPLKVEPPSSHSDKIEPVKGYIKVIVSDSTQGNQILVNMDEYNVRVAALTAKYGQAAAASTDGIIVKREDLKEVLLAARLADPKQAIVLKADKSAKFGFINDIMLTMKEVQFEKVQMTTALDKN